MSLSTRSTGGLLAALATLGLAAGCSPIKWETDYQAGITRAAQLNRRALVEFCNGMSLESRQMDGEVFSDPDVQSLMQNFVAIRVDDVMNRRLVEQFGVQVLPTFFVIRPDLSIAGSHAGKLDLEKFRVFLIKHSYN